jgi:hypothetical protein
MGSALRKSSAAAAHAPSDSDSDDEREEEVGQSPGEKAEETMYKYLSFVDEWVRQLKKDPKIEGAIERKQALTNTLIGIDKVITSSPRRGIEDRDELLQHLISAANTVKQKSEEWKIKDIPLLTKEVITAKFMAQQVVAEVVGQHMASSAHASPVATPQKLMPPGFSPGSRSPGGGRT